MVIFFFKQKTAYEKRISDWSSDVFSSDLVRFRDGGLVRGLIVGSLKHALAAACRPAAPPAPRHAGSRSRPIPDGLRQVRGPDRSTGRPRSARTSDRTAHRDNERAACGSTTEDSRRPNWSARAFCAAQRRDQRHPAVAPSRGATPPTTNKDKGT